jgi:hypothetical protein
MRLQLRLTDPRGERVVEFDPRPVERPVVVGCGAGVDVAVAPLVRDVSARHCFLFEYEGQWFVQDARTPGGTFCNGQPVAGPVAINAGDVVTLGRSDAPATLTVKLLGAAAAEPAIEIDPAVSPEARYYIPQPRRSSPVALTMTALLSLAIIGGGGLWLRSAWLKREAALRPQVVVVAPAAESRATTRTTAPATVRARAVSRPASAPAEPPPAPEDPRKNEPEWRAVEAARFEVPVLAIVRFNDYLERFPETPFKADVDRYVDEAVDRIWWQRLIELFEERDIATKQVDERQGQLRLSQDAEFKEGLKKEIEDWSDRRKLADEEITKTMKYQGMGPPNPYDSAALTALRAQRDADYYAKWKSEVLRTIKRTRGQRLPWKATR